MDSNYYKPFIEVNTHGTDPLDTDSDDDGFSDYYEVQIGYDPNQASSTPDLLSEIETVSTNEIEYRFHAASNASCWIEGTASLESPWTVIETNIIGLGGLEIRLYPLDQQTNYFFRAKKN